MATSNGILAAWPTAAAYLQGARPAPAPSSAGAGPADMESALDEMSRYRATFRAKLKACQLEAALAGESTNPNKLGKVNARMREMNQERGEGGESRILNSWNKSRSGHGPRANTRNKPDERKPKIRLDGPTRKRTGRARRAPSNGGAAKPSSAGAPGAAAAPADTPTATATATVTPAVTSAGAPASAKVDDTFVLSAFLESPAPPSAASGELLLGGGSSVAGAAEPNAAACGGEEPAAEPAAEPSPAGSEFCLSMFLPR